MIELIEGDHLYYYAKYWCRYTYV